MKGRESQAGRKEETVITGSKHTTHTHTNHTHTHTHTQIYTHTYTHACYI
jgi:hypothetical protein